MGAPRRFAALENFIVHNFPPPQRLANVAGGQGNLRPLLAQREYNCTIIDPRNSDLSRPQRQRARRRGITLTRRQKRMPSQNDKERRTVV